MGSPHTVSYSMMGVDDDDAFDPLLPPTRSIPSLQFAFLPHRDGAAAHRAHEKSLYMSERFKNLAATPEYSIHMMFQSCRRSAEPIDGAAL